MTLINIALRVNAYDRESIHFAALCSYLGFDPQHANRKDVYGFDPQALEEALEHLGTSESPNLKDCLIEIWTTTSPAFAGYEIVTSEGDQA